MALCALPLAIMLTDSLVDQKAKWSVTPFDWRGADGRNYSLSDVQSPYILLYMGYLSCDSVCPGRLSELAKISRRVDLSLLRILFVTIDPERDTAEKRGEWIDSLGVMSAQLTQWQLERLRIELKDTGNLKDNPDNHSDRLYLISNNGKVEAVFTANNVSSESLLEKMSTSP